MCCLHGDEFDISCIPINPEKLTILSEAKNLYREHHRPVDPCELARQTHLGPVRMSFVGLARTRISEIP